MSDEEKNIVILEGQIKTINKNIKDMQYHIKVGLILIKAFKNEIKKLKRK